jgi:anti-sigma B factor antagonist
MTSRGSSTPPHRAFTPSDGSRGAAPRVWLRLKRRGRKADAVAQIGAPAPIGDAYDIDLNAYDSEVEREPSSRAHEHSTPPFDVLSPRRGDDRGEDGAVAGENLREEQNALRIQEHIEGHTRRLTLIGQLDLNSAPVLQSEISRCHASGYKSILLDLSRLEFIDSTGLWVITAARRWCDVHGCGFALVPGPESVQSVFELTGLSDVLPFVAAESSALRPQQSTTSHSN